MVFFWGGVKTLRAVRLACFQWEDTANICFHGSEKGNEKESRLKRVFFAAYSASPLPYFTPAYTPP